MQSLHHPDLLLAAIDEHLRQLRLEAATYLRAARRRPRRRTGWLRSARGGAP